MRGAARTSVVTTMCVCVCLTLMTHTGEEEYIDVRQPLLDPEDRRAQQQEQDREERREARNMTLARMRTQHLVLPPDPMIASGMLSPGKSHSLYCFGV